MKNYFLSFRQLSGTGQPAQRRFLSQMAGAGCALAFLALAATPGRAASGVVQSWGYNGYGQLGDNTTAVHRTPVTAVSTAPAYAVAGGVYHSLALKLDGTVLAWGRNDHGQLGDGTTTDHHTAAPVSGLTGITAIATCGSHCLALKSNGTVWAWGYNFAGDLGDGTTTDRFTPVQVSGLTGIVAIAAGGNHSLAVMNDGSVWGWGRNNYGQLGDGTTTDRSTPVRVSGLSGVDAIAAGSVHTVALRNDGTVWAWGYNAYGQLGDGTTTVRRTPVQAAGLSGVAAIASGEFHTLALLGDTTVAAWGRNTEGQLGDGTTTNRHAAVAVGGLSGVAALAEGGYYHSMALKSDGTVWSWGYNVQGQLGDGTGTERTAPVRVSGSSGMSAIANGDYHSLAVLGAGAPGACSGTPPANDDFSAAHTLPGTSGIVTGRNNCATVEVGEPHAGGSSVWYAWTAPQNGHATFTTAGSNFDTTLGAYTGAAVKTLTTVAFNDDAPGLCTSRIDFDATAGITYAIQIDGFDGTTGNYSLHWSFVPQYRILGRIVSPAGAGVPNVAVSRGGGASVVTNGAGYFTLTDVPAGTYTLTPVLSAYLFNPGSRSVTVITADVVNQNFTGTHVFTVTGHLLNSVQTPIPNATVALSPSPVGIPNAAVTDASGLYTFVNVPVGSYTATPTRSGSTFAPATRTVSTASPTADFTVLFNIFGRVATNASVAIPNATLSLKDTTGATVPGVLPAISNASGDYVLSNVPAGLYYITASLAGYAFNPATEGLSVTVAPRGANFIATRVFRVQGRVATAAGAAIANVAVALSPRPAGLTSPVLTNGAGYYLFTGVPQGDYTVTPSLAGYTFTPLSKRVDIDTADALNQNFTGAPAFSISGHIANASGTALAGVQVTRTGSNIPAFTNGNGDYIMPIVTPGAYTLTAVLPGYTFQPASLNVTVGGASLTGENFTGTVIPTYFIQGRIATSSGTAIPNVSVKRSGSPSAVLTNSAGYYLFTGLPNGTYTVTPTLPGSTFTPTTKTVVVSGANVAGQNFVGS